MRLWLVSLGLTLVAIACDPRPRQIELPPLPDAGNRNNEAPVQVCKSGEKTACVGNKHYTCMPSEEFLESVETDCTAMGLTCDVNRGCVACSPGDMRCKTCTDKDGAGCSEDVVQGCKKDGSGWEDTEQCDLENAGEVCSQARCQKACEVAKELRGYVGCEFYAADLDNAALSDMNNASAQQYAVAVANPNRVPVEVRVDQNNAPYGDDPNVILVEKRRVAPGDLEVFKLPRREVDGSSPTGLNDGTHTAVSSQAYRVTSLLPITAFQFNPLENFNVFSNDAALLYPISALGSKYTIVGWPQTIGDSDNPEQDFDNTTSNDDLRAFLTILGTQADTKVDINLGTEVVRVVGAGPVPESGPGASFSVNIGPFDVINLETQGFNADFTGTLVNSSHPVSVFVGSEASDVPMFGTYAKRQCCADHLEQQLLPDTSAGTDYLVARMPQRTKALNAAAVKGTSLGVADVDEPDWIRVVAVTGRTHVRTTLEPPDDDFILPERGDRTLKADRDVLMRSDGPIQVLQAIGSQGITGIPRQYPGGDPSIIAVPPVQQYRRDYIFLTPDKYIFDFVTIIAPRDARIRFDGGDLPDSCETASVEGFAAAAAMGGATGGTDSPPASEIEWVVHRCQLAFPQIRPGQIPTIMPGVQEDGVHTVVSDREVAVIVYGFDRYVSYAYVGGLDFDVLQ
jgi:hypothetical protein